MTTTLATLRSLSANLSEGDDNVHALSFMRATTSGSTYIPQATGSNHGGLGMASDANFKGIYTRFNYRFTLEKDKNSRTAIQAAGPSGPHGHTYLNPGTFYLSIWAFGTAFDWHHH